MQNTNIAQRTWRRTYLRVTVTDLAQGIWANQCTPDNDLADSDSEEEHEEVEMLFPEAKRRRIGEQCQFVIERDKVQEDYPKS